MKKPTMGLLLLFSLVLVKEGLAQGSKTVNGVFAWKEDARVKLVIHNGAFTYIDSRTAGDLATSCCDTLTYGTASPDRGGFLLLKSDASLNGVFVGMEVVERRNPAADSIEFIIHDPIEDSYRKYNPSGGDLLYTMNVDPKGETSDYFKENMQSFEGGPIRYYNPRRVDVNGFSITIAPKCSIGVKNLAVRELHTETYNVKDRSANVFVITMPQLSYGFFSYLRLDGDYAKMVGDRKIVWRGREFVRNW